MADQFIALDGCSDDVNARKLVAIREQIEEQVNKT